MTSSRKFEISSKLINAAAMFEHVTSTNSVFLIMENQVKSNDSNGKLVRIWNQLKLV